MSYRLKVKEPLAEGIRRIALEQIEIVDGELRGNADAHAAVHNSRRALKRLRALLRLVRPGLDEAFYRRETQRFATIGRMLAGERDRHVMRQTLKKLAAQTPDLSKTLLPAFEALLAQGPARQESATDVRARAAAKLAAARKAMSGSALARLDRAHAFQGLETVYRKARRLHRHCHAHPAADEDFHALRKSVQQHWRHMQLLSRAWPEALSARADEAKALSQLLGEDHDLHVLAEFAQAHADALPADGLEALRKAATDAQAALRTRAQLHGDRLFAERATELSARLLNYWAVAQGLTIQEAQAAAAKAAAEPAPVARPQRVRRPAAPKRAKAAIPRARRGMSRQKA